MCYKTRLLLSLLEHHPTWWQNYSQTPRHCSPDTATLIGLAYLKAQTIATNPNRFIYCHHQLNTQHLSRNSINRNPTH